MTGVYENADLWLKGRIGQANKCHMSFEISENKGANLIDAVTFNSFQLKSCFFC